MTSALRAAASAAVLTVALLLSACAGAAPGLAATAARDMQETVVTIAQHAAAGDPAAAVAELDALQQRLDAALAADDITADRAALVQRSIDLVRADLEGVLAENATPAPPATEDAGTGSTSDDPATDDGDTTDDSGKGNSGNGNSGNDGKDGNGKGKGNGNGKGND